MMDGERNKSEIQITNEKVRSLEEQLNNMRNDYNRAQSDLQSARDE
jgi:hypothetical protein